jgi:acid phosphatase family membrane protein YuiD
LDFKPFGRDAMYAITPGVGATVAIKHSFLEKMCMDMYGKPADEKAAVTFALTIMKDVSGYKDPSSGAEEIVNHFVNSYKVKRYDLVPEVLKEKRGDWYYESFWLVELVYK